MSSEWCFLTEQSPVWQGMLADVLKQSDIPFVTESSTGAGMAIRTGSLNETIRFLVPEDKLEAAKNIVEELFSQKTNEKI